MNKHVVNKLTLRTCRDVMWMYSIKSLYCTTIQWSDIILLLQCFCHGGIETLLCNVGSDEPTRPSLWSAMVQESIKVWAMTDSTASTWSEFCTSKMNCGFLRILIQNRSGKLFGKTRKHVLVVVHWLLCISGILQLTFYSDSNHWWTPVGLWMVLSH